MRFVVDADCLIAGTLAASGAASDLLTLWRSGAFELVACPHLVEEVRKTLLDSRISKRYGITAAEVGALCERIRDESIWRPDPIDPSPVVARDPGDDYLVQLGLDGMADALVTRDRHFDGVAIAGLEIIPPRVALGVLSTRGME